MKKFDPKKIVYIPGWMDSMELHPEFEGLNIWKKKSDFSEIIEAEFIVAHSLGTHFALLNWERNKKNKLILINPLLSRKKISFWTRKWVTFFVKEGRQHIKPKRVSLFSHPKELATYTVSFLQRDFFEVIEQIPRGDIWVIRGSRDNFFCTKEICKKLEKKGIRVIEIPGMGHVWDEKLYPVLEEILKG